MTTSEPRIARLCYVDNGVAWFTTDLEHQWGDDWNDAPYDCNAGTPYEYRTYMGELGKAPYALVTVRYDSVLCTPSENDISGVSVEDINAGCIPWLASPRHSGKRLTPVMGGATLSEFYAALYASGGIAHGLVVFDWGETPEDQRGPIADVTDATVRP